MCLCNENGVNPRCLSSPAAVVVISCLPFLVLVVVISFLSFPVAVVVISCCLPSSVVVVT